MAQGNLTFAKIVATPTNSAWSQAYSAGMLFTVLSLKSKETEEDSPARQENDIELKTQGKNILNTI